MSEWWTEPYPRNATPPCAEFPRELNVGDRDGPDAIAYKRAVSRGGRWPWTAFDDTYSKSFANGASPNVRDSGIKGFQRQAGLRDTGVVDEETFNALLRALVPKSLSQGGEPLFDEYALAQLADAIWWKRAYPGNPKPPAVSLTRTLKVGCKEGPDVEAVKRAVSRAGRWPWTDFNPTFTGEFAYGRSGGQVADSGVKGFQRQSGIPDDGIVGPDTFEGLRWALVPEPLMHAGEPLFDAVCVDLLEAAAQQGDDKPSQGVPDLGPVYAGGKSILQHDLTHITGGLPDYPALDDCFDAGREIIAPEDVEVTGQSSANPGDAFYCKGESKLKYWFGHLTSSPSNGSKVRKGAVLSRVLDHNVGGGPHVHVGIDARECIGHPFEAHTNYTHGAPTIGEQLEQALG